MPRSVHAHSLSSSQSERRSQRQKPQLVKTKMPSTPSIRSTNTFSHSRRPSLSNWLTRTSTSSSSKSIPSKASSAIRISEPRVIRSLDALGDSLRSGPLGSGATVVGTPQEALVHAGVQLDHEGRVRSHHSDDERLSRPDYFQTAFDKNDSDLTDQGEDYDDDSEFGANKVRTSPVKFDDELPSPPESPARASPPLPPAPITKDVRNKTGRMSPPRPSRAPPPPPSAQVAEPIPMSRSTTTSTTLSQIAQIDATFPHVPPLLPTIQPVQPIFSAVLISGISAHASLDPNKIVVSIETETQTFKTTASTLTSRPSFLGNYIQSLLPSPGRQAANDDEMSVYSTTDRDEDASIYNRYLASQGVLSMDSFTIRIFLNRPSIPYSHILSYLRAPSNTLPRSLCLSSSNREEKLERLLDVRDECSYLGLSNLHALCSEQLVSLYPDLSFPSVISTTVTPNVHSRNDSTGTTATTIAERERVVITPQSMDHGRAPTHGRSGSHAARGSLTGRWI